MKKKLIGIILSMLVLTTIFSVTANTTKNNTEPLEPLTDDWWTCFGHDPANTRLSTAPALTTDAARILWAAWFNQPCPATVIVVDGYAYIATQYAGGPHNVYCFDADTGSLLWSNKTSYYNVYNQPAVDNGKLFVGGDDKCIYCFNAVTGQQIWKTSALAGSTRCGMTATEGKVFFATRWSNRIYCIDQITGSILWQTTTTDCSSTVPTVVNDRVYFAFEDGTLICYDADPSDGVDEGTTDPIGATYDLIWAHVIPTGDNGLSTCPTVIASNLYIGSSDSHLYCLDSTTGISIWDITVDDPIYTNTAVHEDIIYFSAGQSIYAIRISDHSLAFKSTIPYPCSIGSPSIITDGKLYVAVSANEEYVIGPRIFCLDAITGDQLWFCSFLSYPDINGVTDPSIGPDGSLYISFDNYVVRLGSNTGTPGTPSVPQGPSNGRPQTEYTYTTTIVTDPDGDPVFYEFDWDDGTTTTVSDPLATHIWNDQTTTIHNVKVRAKDASEAMSDWSEPFQVTILNAAPPTPILNGPNEGLINIQYTYTVSPVTDPDGDNVYYNISWGDTTHTGWITALSAKHKWSTTGTYNVTITAKDKYGAISGSSTRIIQIYSTILTFESIEKGVGVLSVLIKNNGTTTATSISWAMTIDGGFWFITGKTKTGTLETLASGDTAEVTMDVIGIGLGFFKLQPVLTVTASSPETNIVQESMEFKIIGKKIW